jgi:hypothetical protein
MYLLFSFDVDGGSMFCYKISADKGYTPSFISQVTTQ